MLLFSTFICLLWRSIYNGTIWDENFPLLHNSKEQQNRTHKHKQPEEEYTKKKKLGIFPLPHYFSHLFLMVVHATILRDASKSFTLSFRLALILINSSLPPSCHHVDERSVWRIFAQAADSRRHYPVRAFGRRVLSFSTSDSHEDKENQ